MTSAKNLAQIGGIKSGPVMSEHQARIKKMIPPFSFGNHFRERRCEQSNPRMIMIGLLSCFKFESGVDMFVGKCS